MRKGLLRRAVSSRSVVIRVRMVSIPCLIETLVTGSTVYTVWLVIETLVTGSTAYTVWLTTTSVTARNVCIHIHTRM